MFVLLSCLLHRQESGESLRDAYIFVQKLQFKGAVEAISFFHVCSYLDGFCMSICFRLLLYVGRLQIRLLSELEMTTDCTVMSYQGMKWRR